MIDAILDPFAIDTSFKGFKSSFPELDRVRMGLEMQLGQAWTFPTSGPISAFQIWTAMCQTGLSIPPISIDAMRSSAVQDVGTGTFGGYQLPLTGPISFSDWRGAGVNCNPNP